jgi:hypothetical protein
LKAELMHKSLQSFRRWALPSRIVILA